TKEGRALATVPSGNLEDRLLNLLNGPQRSVYSALRGNGALSRADLASALGWSAESGHLKNVLGSLRTLDVVRYPKTGEVDLTEWVRGDA
ncbi:hypothetical protein SDB63_24790, partial [Brucella sp. NBRC 113783]